MEVQLPDGTVVEFPDGTPPEVMERAIKDFLSTPDDKAKILGSGPAQPVGVPDPINPISRDLNERAMRNPTSTLGRIFDLGVQDIGRPAVRAVGDFLGRDPVRDPATGERLSEVGSPAFSTAANLSTGSEAKLAAAFIAESDDDKRAKIIEANVPGAKASTDGKGNVIVTLNGQQFLINQPGPSMQDLGDVATQIGEILVAIRSGGKGNLLKQGARIGATVGGLTFGKDVASSSLGSSRDLSDTPQRALISGGAAGLLTAGGGAFAKGLRNLMLRGQFASSGVLTSQARSLLKKNKVDPDTLTPETIRELRTILPKAKSVQEAVRLAEARGLKVPLTRGDVARDPAIQATEDAGVKGAIQGRAADDLRLFKTETQPSALTEAARTTGQRVGQRPFLSETGEGVGVAQAALSKQATSARREINKAFTAAKAGNTRIVTEALVPFRKKAKEIARDFDRPSLNRLAGQLDQMKGSRAVSINALEKWRKRVTILTRPNNLDAVEREGARKLKALFDDTVNGLDDNAFSVGSREGIDAFKRARTLRAEFGKKFEGSRTVQDIVSGKLAPSEAADALLGAAATGPKGAVQAVNQIKSTLGPKSEGFRAIKQEVILKLFNRSGKSMLTEGRISGDVLASNIDKLITKRPELARALFTQKELEMIGTLRRVAQTATSPARGAVNTSNTTIVSRILSNLIGPRAREFSSRLPLVRAFTESRAPAVLRKSLNEGRLLTPRGPPRSGVFGAPVLNQDVGAAVGVPRGRLLRPLPRLSR